MAEQSLCSIPNCRKIVRSRGYCSSHYQRLRRYGNATGSPTQKPQRICSVDFCGSPARRNGYCEKHNYRTTRYGDAFREPWKNEPVDWLKSHVETSKRECLLWPFFVDRTTGYGRISMKTPGGGSKSGSAHRYMCELSKGPPPSRRHQAAHACGNKQCVNPRHLSWKTQKQNEADKLIHGTATRGVRSGAAKLTAEDVVAIRGATGVTQKALAERYGVSRGHIAALRSGRFWPDIQPQQR